MALWVVLSALCSFDASVCVLSNIKKSATNKFQAPLFLFPSTVAWGVISRA